MKYLILADIHFVEKNKYREKAQEVLLKKINVYRKKYKVDSLIVCGDLFNNARNISIKSIIEIARVFKQFNHVYLLVGNHDVTIRSKNVTSLPDIFSLLPNVTVISQNEIIDDFCFLTYYDNNLSCLKTKYVFAHKDIVELNKFYEEEYAISIKQFNANSIVFNGHIHKHFIREYDNCKYIQIGAPYPTRVSDGNENRFAMFLDTNNEEIKEIPLNIAYYPNIQYNESVDFFLEFPTVDKNKTEQPSISLDEVKNISLDLKTILNKIKIDKKTQTYIERIVEKNKQIQVVNDKL